MERERSRKKVRKIGEVLKALACCSGYDPCCDRCPYLDSHFAGMSCTDELLSECLSDESYSADASE